MAHPSKNGRGGPSPSGVERAQSRQDARKGRDAARTPKGNSLREKIARIRADKSLSQAEKDRMIKSLKEG